MTETSLSAAERRRSLAAVIASITIFALTLGMTFPLLSLILERQGVSATMIGLNGAMSSLGILISAPYIPRLVERTGAAGFMFGCIAVTAAMLLLLRAYVNVYAWFPMRLVMGVAVNGLFVLSETWLNQVADNRSRGRLVGLYVTALSLSFAAGPLLIPLVGTRGWTPFVAGVAVIAVAALPLLWARRLSPDLGGTRPRDVTYFFRAAPTLLGAVIVVSLITAAVMSLLPVYGLQTGFAEDTAALMLAAFVLGNVGLQLPVGWLADRFDRRWVMMLCAAAVAVLSIAVPAATGIPALLWPMLFAWGGMLFGIYTVALTLLGERYSGADLVAANAAFALMWGLGGITGPAVAGAAMDLAGPFGLPFSVAAAAALFVAVAALRRRAGAG